MTIAALITEVVSIITDPAIAPFFGFAIVVGAAGSLFRRLAKSTK
jgi:hypothetical protein